MENASKALIMAGSLLTALLVIGLVSFAYTQISNIQQTKSDVEQSTKMINYARRFEDYNKRIYGSELLSLGNLQLDYNDRQADMKGYNPIIITVKITKAIKEDSKTYLNIGEQSINDVRNGMAELEGDIEFYEDDANGYRNEVERNKRSVKYYAQMSNRQIATLFGIDFSSSELDYEIGDRLADEGQNPKTSRLLKDIETYKNLKTTYTEFKNTSFTCTNVQYDDNGIISTMYFTEN